MSKLRCFLLNYLSKNCWYYLLISLPFVFVIHEQTIRHDLMNTVVVDITSWNIATMHIWEEGIIANGFNKVIYIGFALLYPFYLYDNELGQRQLYWMLIRKEL